MNFDSGGIYEYDEMVSAFVGRGSYNYTPKKLDRDLKNRATPPSRPSTEEPSVL